MPQESGSILREGEKAGKGGEVWGGGGGRACNLGMDSVCTTCRYGQVLHGSGTRIDIERESESIVVSAEIYWK